MTRPGINSMTRRSGSTNANPFPLPTGTSRKKRRSGGRHGRNFVSDKPEVAAVKGAYLQTAKLVERGTGEHRAAYPCRKFSIFAVSLRLYRDWEYPGFPGYALRDKML